MYEDAYAIIQSSQTASSAQFRARVIDCLLRYEAAKAIAAISLSTKVFRRLNPRSSEPTDAAGDRRTAGGRPPDGRENALDIGGPEKAGGGGIGFHAGDGRGDAGDREAGQRRPGAVGAARSIQVCC
jgi:hypothetical protein